MLHCLSLLLTVGAAWADEPGDAPAEPGPDGQDPFTGDGGNPGPDYGLLAC